MNENKVNMSCTEANAGKILSRLMFFPLIQTTTYTYEYFYYKHALFLPRLLTLVDSM